MCILQIRVQCYARFFEVISDEKEQAEFFVEEVVGHALADLFNEPMVDVTMKFSTGLPSGLHHWAITIKAHCSCKTFASFPCSEECIKLAVQQRVCSILKEYFVTVKVDDVTFRHSEWECEVANVLSSRV
jgi:hypothetical protein